MIALRETGCMSEQKDYGVMGIHCEPWVAGVTWALDQLNLRTTLSSLVVRFLDPQSIVDVMELSATGSVSSRVLDAAKPKIGCHCQ